MIKKIFLLMLIMVCFTQANVLAKTKIKKVICKPVLTVEDGIYEGFQIVKCDKTYGIKNSFSHIMVNPKYTKMENINNKNLKVKFDKSYGLIDFTGKVLVTPKYKDVQVAEFKLANEEPFYVYIAKNKKNWVIVDGENEKNIVDKVEKISVLETNLQLVPHKFGMNDRNYYLQIGTIKMGELLSGTPLSIMIPDKLPKWTINQISTEGLMKLFLEKK